MQKGLGQAGKLYMVGEDQRVYVVDNLKAGSGTYFEGSWEDKDKWESVTLGSSRDRSGERIKVNQATLDYSQRNNLRSSVWVSVVVFDEDVSC